MTGDGRGESGGKTTTKPMPKRNLRIVKRTPIAIGICESCNMQFGSHQPIEDDAEAEMRAAFDAHKCKREHASQAAARIVQEAADWK